MPFKASFCLLSFLCVCMNIFISVIIRARAAKFIDNMSYYCTQMQMSSEFHCGLQKKN